MVRAARSARRRLRVQLLEGAHPFSHTLEQLPGDLGVRLDERLELPRGQPPALEVRVGGDARCARAVIDEGDLAEVVARAEHDAVLAPAGHLRRAGLDHEEADPALSL